MKKDTIEVMTNVNHFIINGCVFNIESIYRREDTKKDRMLKIDIFHIPPVKKRQEEGDNDFKYSTDQRLILITHGTDLCVIRDGLFPLEDNKDLWNNQSDEKNLLWEEKYIQWMFYLDPEKDKCVLFGFVDE